MNGAASNSTTNTDQNTTILPTQLTQPNYIPKRIHSDHAIDSSTSPAALPAATNQIVNKTHLKAVNTQVIPHPYMNMAAVAAAFLQGGFNSHLNNSPQSPFPNMHQHSQGHQFFPPPPPTHGFGPDISNLVSTSSPKTFVSPSSVPLQPHRIPRSSPTSSDKPSMDDSGIGGMMSSPLSTPTSECSSINSSTGCSNSGSGGLKRKYSITSSSNAVNIRLQNATSSNAASGNLNNSVTTPTSTMTRTHQYKKFMKPLLERKRRARINKCLDELKEIMTAALTSQGENVSKLEKADILELTVNHLNKMHQARRLMVSTNRNPLEEIHRFQAGYSSCAQEAASFLLATPGVDVRVSQKLLSHLSANTMTSRTPYGPVQSPLPPSFSMNHSSFGMSVPPNLSNSMNADIDETKLHQEIAQYHQSNMSGNSSLESKFSSSSAFQSTLPATATSRRRSSGGTSSASGSLLSPKEVSSSSLPANSPTSSLIMESPARSSSFCDTRTIETLSVMDDKKRIDFMSNSTPSPTSSTFSPANSNGKDTSLAHLTVSITADTDVSDNDEMESCEKNIKLEHGCDKNVYLTNKKTMSRGKTTEKNMEMKHVPIKPEPIRLPSLHQQPQSITDPVWRPF